MSKTIWALLNSKMGCRMGWFAGSRIHGSWVDPKGTYIRYMGQIFIHFFKHHSLSSLLTTLGLSLPSLLLR